MQAARLFEVMRKARHETGLAADQQSRNRKKRKDVASAWQHCCDSHEHYSRSGVQFCHPVLSKGPPRNIGGPKRQLVGLIGEAKSSREKRWLRPLIEGRTLLKASGQLH